MNDVLQFPSIHRPAATGLIHVEQGECGGLEVLHEGRSGESFATLRHFDADERDKAVAYALAELPRCNSKLGRGA